MSSPASSAPAPSALAAPTAAPADTAPREPRMPELVAYGSPALGSALANAAFVGLAFPILNMTLGVSPVVIGLALAVTRLWDAVTDPLMGHFSDGFRSRFGRRRPFIALGAIAMGACTALAWWLDRSWDESAMGWWFLGALLFFYTAVTVCNVPYYALGMEMSSTYHGRTRVVAVRSFFDNCAQFLAPWLFPFCLLPFFSDALEGARWLGLLCGALMAGLGLLAASRTRERRQERPAAPREKFWSAIRGTAANPHFLRIAGIYAILILMLSVFTAINIYVGIYYVFRGDQQLGATVGAIASTLGSTLALAAIPLVAWISRRIGKHNALRIALGLMIAGSLLKWICYTPEHPYLQLVVPFFYSLGISSVFTVLGAMMADVVDSDELRSGRRREGLFGAAASWIMKSAGALGTAASGWILALTGFDIALGGEQSPDAFFWMRINFSVLPALMAVGALLLLRRYPLTAARVAAMRAELEARSAS